MNVKPLSTLQRMLTAGLARARLECASSAACPRLLLITLKFLHSPGRLMQSQTKAVALYLPVRERFGQDIGRHIFSGTVDHLDGPTCYDFADEVDAYVDVLRARMVVIILRELERGLIVTEERGRRLK